MFDPAILYLEHFPSAESTPKKPHFPQASASTDTKLRQYTLFPVIERDMAFGVIGGKYIMSNINKKPP